MTTNETLNSSLGVLPSNSYKVWQLVVLASLAACVILITIFGNLIVIASFILERSIRQPTNYFIASLAVSDLIIGVVSMPFYTVYLLTGQYWPLGQTLCDIWLSVDYTVCLCSIYTVFCITIDRFCSVKIVTKYRNLRTKRKVLVIISLTWILPAAVFFTSIIGWQYFVGERTVEKGRCYVQYMENAYFNCFLQVGYFWITLVAMCTLYVGIYTVALRLQKESERRYNKMLLLESRLGGKTEVTELGLISGEQQGNMTSTGEGKRTKHEHRPKDPPSSPSSVSNSETNTGSGETEKKLKSPVYQTTSKKSNEAKALIPKRKHQLIVKLPSFKQPTLRFQKFGKRPSYVVDAANANTFNLETFRCSVDLPDLIDRRSSGDCRDPAINYAQKKDGQMVISTEILNSAVVVVPDGTGHGTQRRPCPVEDLLNTEIVTDRTITEESCREDVKGQSDNDNNKGSKSSIVQFTNAGQISKQSIGEAKTQTQQLEEAGTKDSALLTKEVEHAVEAIVTDATRDVMCDCDVGSHALSPVWKHRTKSTGEKATLLTPRKKRRKKEKSSAPQSASEKRDRNHSDSYSDSSSSSDKRNEDEMTSSARRVLLENISTESNKRKRFKFVKLKGLAPSRLLRRKTKSKDDEQMHSKRNGLSLSSHREPARSHFVYTASSRHFLFSFECFDPRKLWDSVRHRWRKEDNRKKSRNENRARKALRTITLILGAFVICWTPWHILSLIIGFCGLDCIKAVLYDISYWLCYLNSPLNPFCYAFANRQFKRTFLRILRLDWHRT